MKKAGYWSGPGPFAGTFTETTTAAHTYLRDKGDQVAFVDLYQITLLTLGTVNTSTGVTAGLVLRHAAADYDVAFEGVLYAGGGANGGWRLARKQLRTEIGTSVGELDVSVMTDGTDRLPPADGNVNTPRFGLGEAVHGGLFDGAHVLYRRLLLPRHPTYPYNPLAIDTTLGALTCFAGQVDDPIVTQSQVTLKVKSYLARLAAPMPRNIYQAGCLNSLYDYMCNVSRTGNAAGVNFQYLGALASWDTATNSATVTPTPAQPAGYFTLGTLTFTSGVLCGMAFPIINHAGAVVTSMLTPPRAPASGDTVCIQAGCDKVGLLQDPSTGNVVDGTCATKFNNLPRFRGFAHVPPPETAL